MSEKELTPAELKRQADAILAAADAVTDTNDRDGVAKALERFVLNG